MNRRHFLAGSGAAMFYTITSKKSFLADLQEQRAHIDLNGEIAAIRPELHGQFAEHLGSCVYGGLWVGHQSAIANTNGFRADAVRYLKELGVPVLRWPGGCFADDYHWRDGIGAQRPRSL